MGNFTVSNQSFLDMIYMSPDYALSLSVDGILGLGLNNKISSNLNGSSLFDNLAKQYKLNKIFSMYVSR